jgi:hypothetical protein
MAARFRLGELVVLDEAADVLYDSAQKPTDFLLRHMEGDCGYAREPIVDGRRVSVYKTLTGKMAAIVTEADQQKTSVILADESLLKSE